MAKAEHWTEHWTLLKDRVLCDRIGHTLMKLALPSILDSSCPCDYVYILGDLHGTHCGKETLNAWCPLSMISAEGAPLFGLSFLVQESCLVLIRCSSTSCHCCSREFKKTFKSALYQNSSLPSNSHLSSGPTPSWNFARGETQDPIWGSFHST